MCGLGIFGTAIDHCNYAVVFLTPSILPAGHLSHRRFALRVSVIVEVGWSCPLAFPEHVRAVVNTRGRGACRCLRGGDLEKNTCGVGFRGLGQDFTFCAPDEYRDLCLFRSIVFNHTEPVSSLCNGDCRVASYIKLCELPAAGGGT